MTRIIAGSAKGRPLSVPKAGTRPTSDRVRESLFSMLNHDFANDWSEVRVLDLFAGTGAIGLEALSRGARSATAVESHPDAIKVINANKSVTNLPLEIVRADVQKWVTQPAATKFDLVFLDPPYDFPSADLQAIVDHVIQHCVAEGAIVLVERSSRSTAITAPPEWESSERKFGDTTVQKLVW